MTPGEIVMSVLFGLGVIYLAARLVTAAFFKSKQQYEQQRKQT